MAAKSEEHRGDARVVAKSPCRSGGPAIARHLRCVSRGVIARQHGQSHNGFGAGSVGLAFHFMKEGYE